MTVDRPGQHVLERSSCVVRPDGTVEARFTVALPAAGRSVLGRWARDVLCDNLPRYVAASLVFASLDAEALRRHADAVEDARHARGELPRLGLVAWVADGSTLARKSGVSDEPMAGAVTTLAPASLAVELVLPHQGRVRGLGVRPGVTLAVGGGFHGKSTLLRALEVGVYEKIPGDGRELVVTVPSAVKVRAEDGRRVAAVDIKPFIGRLPGGRQTECFDSDDASGSTSQAAGIQEAIEAGAKLLLIDEDTSATNFMVRDSRMRALIAAEQEPITPFVRHVRRLVEAAGVSTVMVVGGTGDYFGVADTVIGLRDYALADLTDRAHEIARAFGKQEQKMASKGLLSDVVDGDAAAGGEHAHRPWHPPRDRVALLSGLQGFRDIVKAKTRDKDHILIADGEIDLSAVEQLVERSQTRAVAASLVFLVLHAQEFEHMTLAQMLDSLDRAMDVHGLDALMREPTGDLARPRRFEIAAAVNRWRGLPMRQQS